MPPGPAPAARAGLLPRISLGTISARDLNQGHEVLRADDRFVADAVCLDPNTAPATIET